MPRSRAITALLVASLSLPGFAAAAALEGRWCLTDVAAADASRTRAIGRDWTFAGDGVLRVQSEASSDVRMSVTYRLDDGHLVVPELDLRLRIERRDATRMTALSEARRLRYRFERRPCTAQDRKAREGGAAGGRDRADEGRGRGRERDAIDGLP